MNSDQLRKKSAMVVAVIDSMRDFGASLDERLDVVSEVLLALQTTKQELADKKLGVTK